VTVSAPRALICSSVSAGMQVARTVNNGAVSAEVERTP
jgi:hypothetical protein